MQRYKDRLLLLLALGAGVYPLLLARAWKVESGILTFTVAGLLGTLLVARWPAPAWPLIVLGSLPSFMFLGVTIPFIVIGGWAPLKVLGAAGFQLWACGRISGGIR